MVGDGELSGRAVYDCATPVATSLKHCASSLCASWLIIAPRAATLRQEFDESARFAARSKLS